MEFYRIEKFNDEVSKLIDYIRQIRFERDGLIKNINYNLQCKTAIADLIHAEFERDINNYEEKIINLANKFIQES